MGPRKTPNPGGPNWAGGGGLGRCSPITTGVYDDGPALPRHMICKKCHLPKRLLGHPSKCLSNYGPHPDRCVPPGRRVTSMTRVCLHRGRRAYSNYGHTRGPQLGLASSLVIGNDPTAAQTARSPPLWGDRRRPSVPGQRDRFLVMRAAGRDAVCVASRRYFVPSGGEFSSRSAYRARPKRTVR